MLEQPMMYKLAAMRLHGMMEALQQQQKEAGMGELSFLERLAMVVDHQWNWRQNQALVPRPPEMVPLVSKRFPCGFPIELPIDLGSCFVNTAVPCRGFFA